MYKIAIDGPSGVGKSTLAKSLSRRLGFLFQTFGEVGVGGHPARRRHGLQAGFVHGAPHVAHELLDDRRLERGGEVGECKIPLRRRGGTSEASDGVVVSVFTLLRLRRRALRSSQ